MEAHAAESPDRSSALKSGRVPCHDRTKEARLALEDAPGFHLDDEGFRKLLQHFQLSWSGYRRVRKGVKRRLGRRMALHGYMDVEGYLRKITEDPTEERTARELLTVSISRFFRDRKLWSVLGEYFLPRWAGKSRQDFRVWFAGCACGEEVYSFKILWEAARTLELRLPPLALCATDMNPEVLDRARAGKYPPGSLKEVPPEWLRDYFCPVETGFEVLPPLKGSIQWRLHDFTADDPPLDAVEVLFVRNNLLTYYLPQVSGPVLDRMLGSLLPGGLLVVGNNEVLPPVKTPLLQSPLCKCIWVRQAESAGKDAPKS